jgi:hypothetical protein
MKKAVLALALTMLAASPALAHGRHHSYHRHSYHHFRHHAPRAYPLAERYPGRLVPRLVSPRQGRQPAGTTWHDYARWGAPPMPTRTFARSQDGERWQRVDTYDVIVNGAIVGRDPDPNIRFQLMRESMQPAG